MLFIMLYYVLSYMVDILHMLCAKNILLRAIQVSFIASLGHFCLGRLCIFMSYSEVMVIQSEYI